MPSARIQYDINPAAMIYASYGRGFKSGGFNGTETSGDAANVPFVPEYVTAYEVGLKSEWLEDSLLANVAVFRSDYSDLQVSFWDFPQGGGGAVPHMRNSSRGISQSNFDTAGKELE